MATVEWPKKASRFDPILVVASQRGVAASLAEMLRGLGPVPEVLWAGTTADAWRHMEALHPKLIFVEQVGRDFDGLALVQKLRRSPFASRRSAVVMICDEATVLSMRAAQNAGAHEFLLRPFSAVDLGRRLEAICVVPRNWIEAETYVGPDRRRFNSAAGGPERRKRGASTSPPKPA